MKVIESNRGFVKFAEECIDDNWVKSRDDNFIKKQLFSRLGYATLVPGYMIACIADTIMGIGAKTVDFATLGRFEPCKIYAKIHLPSFERVLSDPYYAFIRTINPGAEFNFEKNDMFATTGKVVELLVFQAKKFTESDSFILKNVASRLTFALAALAAMVTRVVDGIIMLPHVFLSVAICGAFVLSNSAAYEVLMQLPKAVTDFFKYATCAVTANPPPIEAEYATFY